MLPCPSNTGGDGAAACGSAFPARVWDWRDALLGVCDWRDALLGVFFDSVRKGLTFTVLSDDRSCGVAGRRGVGADVLMDERADIERWTLCRRHGRRQILAVSSETVAVCGRAPLT